MEKKQSAVLDVDRVDPAEADREEAERRAREAIAEIAQEPPAAREKDEA